MAIAEKIQSKLDFDIQELIDRLETELNLYDSKNNKHYYALYDVVMIILEYTHLDILTENMESLIVDMTKDYWYFNRLDKSTNGNNATTTDRVAKAVTRGDTKTEFADGKTVVNGVAYSTGTINADDNILLSKYADRLTHYRKLRW